MQPETQPPVMPGSFNGIHHLKLPCASIRKTHDFYTKIFPFVALPQYDHYTPEHKLFALLFMHPSTNLVVEARYDPKKAKAQEGWDPITWALEHKRI
ncbi:hypothetical protein F5884DRAFT_507580 [Xylogone sp. PMI_703]|nr:hypothetical protein F5884DRAFT_507580 [Xylogone sp. PMI_703]